MPWMAAIVPALQAVGAAAAAAAPYVAAGASVLGVVASTNAQVGQVQAQAGADQELARQTIEVANEEADIDRKRSKQIIAKQRAGAAAAGLDVDSGTPLALLMDSTFNAELNALNIRKQGEQDAMALRYRARAAKSQVPGMIFGGTMNAISGGLNSLTRTSRYN